MEQIKTLLDGFNELVLSIWPILSAASARGIPIDIEEHSKLTTFLLSEQKRIYENIQSKVTDEIKKIYPVDGFVRTPPMVSQLVEIYNTNVERIRRDTQCKGGNREENGEVKIISLDQFIYRKSYHEIVKKDPKTKRERRIGARYRFAEFEVLVDSKVVPIGRWCRIEDFNPRSYKQLISYMKWKKHKVPVKLTGEETSDAKELERLAISTGDIFYDEVIEYRSVSKMLSNDLPNWKPVEGEEEVHSLFSFYPATGQLSARKPNSQNVSKHKALSGSFRRIIRARSDTRGGGTRGDGGRRGRRLLVELDWSGFHALMLGREAQSERYMFLAQNDIHSWFASHILNMPINCPTTFDRSSTDAFRKRTSDFKKEYKIVRDTQAKPTILGIGLGLGYKKMYWQNRERFDRKLKQMVGIKSETQSKNLQGLLKELLGEIFEYHERIKEEAFRQTYLISNWGFIRWLFDVKGEDGERAIAFRVQNHAHGMLRMVIRENEDLGYNEKYRFINTIHDSLIFEPWEDELEECIRNVSKIMEKPCLVLADKKVCPNGLIVKVEASWGENWSEYNEKENQGGMRVWNWKT